MTMHLNSVTKSATSADYDRRHTFARAVAQAKAVGLKSDLDVNELR
jgi:hypothetical protein